MNNEEKNLTPEAESEENIDVVEQVKKPSAQPQISGGIIAAIIGCVAVVLVAVILLVLLLPKGDGGNGDGNGDGTSQGDGAGDKDGKVKYTVSVVDQDGNPVAGVSVFFDPKGGKTTFTMSTKEDGKVSYSTENELSVQILAVPEGYQYDKLAQAQKFDKDGNLKITVTKAEKKEPVGTKYIIRVVDQNGKAVVGAMVQMCVDEEGGTCLIPVTTDENGEGIYTEEEKSYKAAITSLPSGYEEISKGYAYFVDGVATIEVVKTAE